MVSATFAALIREKKLSRAPSHFRGVDYAPMRAQ
jgi:hypothetical protein